MVTDDLLKEFKSRMHIFHKGEDDNLKQLLSFSIAFVESKVGKFNIESDERFDRQAKELVFERTRYAYNDALEYFEDNFLSEILSLIIESAGDEDVEE